MMEKTLKNIFDEITPSHKVKDRILENILQENDTAGENSGNCEKLFSIRKIAAVPATVVCLLMVCVTAFSADIFGIQKLVLRKENVGITIESACDISEESGGNDVHEAEMMFLNGTVESPEFMACREYLNFIDEYDPDGEILKKADEMDIYVNEKYAPYICYTEEMAEKIDDICEKYGLKLLGNQLPFSEEQDLYAAAGVGQFTIAFNSSGNNMVYPDYVYEDGTFKIEGDITIYESEKLISYECLRTMKGSFSTVLLNIENSRDYDQWLYTTADGTEILLAMSPYKSVIICDMNDAYITVNIQQVVDPDGNNVLISRTELEQIAEFFDFSELK